MITTKSKTIIYKKQPVTAIVQRTEDGIQLLIAGGDRSHIGAVTICTPEGALQTMSYPGHKDSAVSETWARAFWQTYRVPVTASAGIHYDHITQTEISDLLSCTKQMLEEMLYE